MECSVHPMTELMVRDGGTEMRDGTPCRVRLYYCPRCVGQPVRRRALVLPDGTEVI